MTPEDHESDPDPVLDWSETADPDWLNRLWAASWDPDTEEWDGPTSPPDPASRDADPLLVSELPALPASDPDALALALAGLPPSPVPCATTIATA